MNDISIDLRNGRTAYHPGDRIEGRVRWWLDSPPGKIEIQLFWTTRGKGDVDTQRADAMVLENPDARGDREFSFTAPASPYSFSGKLISLMWSVKATAWKAKQEAQANFFISPTGVEILLSPT